MWEMDIPLTAPPTPQQAFLLLTDSDTVLGRQEVSMEREPAASGGLGMDTQNIWVQNHVLTFEQLLYVQMFFRRSAEGEDKPLSPLTLVVVASATFCHQLQQHIALWLPGIQGHVSWQMRSWHFPL